MLSLSNEHIVFESTAENQTFVVVLNPAAHPAELDVPPTASVLLSGNGHVNANTSRLTLPARAGRSYPPAHDQTGA